MQRGPVASGGPGPALPLVEASCSERLGTGLGGGGDPEEERDAGRKMRNRNKRWCWLLPKALGPRGAVCTSRMKAWSMFDDLILLLGVFYSF